MTSYDVARNICEALTTGALEQAKWELPKGRKLLALADAKAVADAGNAEGGKKSGAGKKRKKESDKKKGDKKKVGS